MAIFDAKFELKSSQHATAIGVAGGALALAYKFYKFTLTPRLHITPNDYYLWEQHCTYFRIFGSIVGLALLFWAYARPHHQLKMGHRPLFFINIFLLVPFYFFFRQQYFKASLSSSAFIPELFFNSFTGVFEELVFRGCLFASMAYFRGVGRAAVVSSLFFSL